MRLVLDGSIHRMVGARKFHLFCVVGQTILEELDEDGYSMALGHDVGLP
jgi:hypothetical protein